MLKRTLVFSNAVNLTLKNMQLVISFKEIEREPTSVPIEDIGCVIIENQRVGITIPLINALADSNVQVIFCNNKNMPNSMLYNLDNNITQGETLRNQMAVGKTLKKQMWKQIVEAKIRNQSRLLDKIGCNGAILRPYYQNVKSGDADNREGIAARLYFQELMGKNFVRDRQMFGINALLNYGYTILRAAVARSLVASGLFPAIGIYHHHRSNAFPLADDMMEPYRPYVDEAVYEMICEGEIELTQMVKTRLINVLYTDTYFEKVTRPLSVGLSLSSASLVRCYSKEQNTLTFPLLQ
ncbi:MAG: type II CRISPR-associated endonuclease Cas1 [Prevotella sp.]|nr:type II CRISPR-associated endonuclease Cas1 [Prevotella sp.]